jgi:hypothetical protein
MYLHVFCSACGIPSYRLLPLHAAHAFSSNIALQLLSRFLSIAAGHTEVLVGVSCHRHCRVYCHTGARNRVVARVAPAPGLALLHLHGEDRCLEHEGAEVQQGVKYVLRSDVVFAAPS